MDELNKQLENVLTDFIEAYDLNYGNGYVEMGGDYVGVSVEAPNNATIYISFDDELETIKEIYEDNENYISNEDILYELIPEIKSRMYDFDADEEFIEIWSRDFEYRPSEFIAMLQEDEEYFRDVASQL